MRNTLLPLLICLFVLPNPAHADGDAAPKAAPEAAPAAAAPEAAAPAKPADEKVQEEKKEEEGGIFDVLNKGGEFMWILLLTSIAMLALVGERAHLMWIKWQVDGLLLLDSVKDLIEKHDSYTEAMKLCVAHEEHPVARVLHAGLLKANQNDREIERAIEETAVRELPRVMARTGYIGMVANVATLLGLLGTIFGLIQAFKAVGAASAAMKQEMLAKGISVAMFTTAFGLIVAIPAMVFHSILTARQTKITDNIGEASISLFNFVSARNKRLRQEGNAAHAATDMAVESTSLGDV